MAFERVVVGLSLVVIMTFMNISKRQRKYAVSFAEKWRILLSDKKKVMKWLWRWSFWKDKFHFHESVIISICSRRISVVNASSHKLQLPSVPFETLKIAWQFPFCVEVCLFSTIFSGLKHLTYHRLNAYLIREVALRLRESCKIALGHQNSPKGASSGYDLELSWSDDNENLSDNEKGNDNENFWLC